MDMRYPMILPEGTSFFLIVGAMKSGTTWLTNALDHHPEICSRGEMHAIEILDNPDVLVAPTLESTVSHDYAMRQWYMLPNNGWNAPFRQPALLRRAAAQLDEDVVRFHFERTMFRYIQATGGPMPHVFGDKSPSHTAFTARKIARFLGPYNPTVIHMVRDPRDVAASRWFHYRRLLGEMGEGGQETGARAELFDNPEHLRMIVSEWELVNSGLLRDGPRLFGDRYRLVRYEDMKREFEGTLRPILQQLDVDASDATLRGMYQGSDPSRMPVKPDVWRKGSVGDGVASLSRDELEVVRDLTPSAAQLGYDLELTAVQSPQVAETVVAS